MYVYRITLKVIQIICKWNGRPLSGKVSHSRLKISELAAVISRGALYGSRGFPQCQLLRLIIGEGELSCPPLICFFPIITKSRVSHPIKNRTEHPWVISTNHNEIGYLVAFEYSSYLIPGRHYSASRGGSMMFQKRKQA